MRRIVHLSDVHFGTVDRGAAESVINMVNNLRPDVVVVSGDLTQRAKSSEFKAARAFLDALPGPQVVVPGNHDIPARNLLARFFTPLAKYRRYITGDLTPTYVDEELAIIGLNTARSMVLKGGRVNRRQIEFVRSRMCRLSKTVLKIVVTHHPFDLPENSHHSDVVGRADMAMPAIAGCGGDILLAGHLHVSNIQTTAKRYTLPSGGNPLVIQAGTATSTRVRGESRSFNLIEANNPHLRVERYDAAAGEPFVPVATKAYTRCGAIWERDEDVKGHERPKQAIEI